MYCSGQCSLFTILRPIYMCMPPQPPLEEMPDDPSISSPPISADPPLDSTDSTPPSSPGWRRAPSYEQLQEIVFSPSSPSPTSSLSMQPPRRALTLSLSGSDVFSDELRSSKSCPHCVCGHLSNGAARNLRLQEHPSLVIGCVLFV